MGRLFWSLIAFSSYHFVRYWFILDKKTPSYSNSNLLYNCASDSVDRDTTFSDAFSLCSSVMSNLSMTPPSSANARGHMIIGLFILALAIWRGYYVWLENKK